MNQLSTSKYKELLGILIDHKLTFENHLLNIVLETDLSQLIRNLQILTTKMYKILNGLSPDIMQDIFETTSNYHNTSNAPAFSSRNIKTVRYGSQTTSYMAPKIWNIVPKEMKQATILNECKAKIKIWKLENCPCGTYLSQIGFII